MPNFKTVITFFFFIFFLFPPPSTCSSNQTDQLSLLAIKSNLQDPQGSLSSWNQTLHFCSWTGVQCGRRNPNRVVSLNLASGGLIGSLSPHIGNLSFLTTIILKNNTFQGPIPPQIGLLPRLQSVDFSNNSFTGPIPANLSQCSNLVEIVLTRNKVSGTLPSELGLLPKLEDLSLSRNNFSGPIPPSIGNISSLVVLSLGSCGFNGMIPESLGQLSRLEFLQLSNNGLTGIIPNGLYNLSNVEYFDVSVNNLEGVIPSTIGLTLPNLAVLLLERNQFSGPIPSSISNATLLEWIVLSSNKFTGPIPNLERLTIAEDFFLHSNFIEDDMSFISQLTNSSKLVHLDVSENMLRGSLPDSIANLSFQLSMLYLHKNRIHGSIPLGIGSLFNLEVVDLSENLLDGLLPFSVSKLFNLQTILLGRNRFTGIVPSVFGNMTLLSRFRLNGNGFSGNVPSSLGNLTHLLELDLSDNNFSGLIPPEIMRLSSVSIVFNLSHNAFEGSIPYEVGSLSNLAALDLSSNRLSGIIPSSVSACSSLEQLYLDENLLEGEVPAGMSALMGLQDLDLSKNSLSGLIPTFLGNLRLEKLNLSFNRLHGEVPTRGVFRNKTAVSLDGNLWLCGGNAELELPPCSRVQSSKRKFPTFLNILIPILVVGCLGIVLLVQLNCTRKEKHDTTPIVPSKGSILGAQLMKLSYADLQRATNGFSESNLLGFGRFGCVYRAFLDDENTFAAVKVLNLAVRGASKTFMAECRVLGGIRHRNLVKLLSVCDSKDFQGYNFKALVYDFKINGSLESWLYSKEESGEGAKNDLSITQRLNIAIDVAKGIKYLHSGVGSTIVHGDLKPSNILLDYKMVACVGDFGLAKMVSSILPFQESNTSSIGINGTLGYLPPEYGTFGSVSTQGDVYSYGIILLEMFTNKRPTDDSFRDHLNLHKFVSSALPDRVMEVVDPRLETEPLKMGKEIECVARVLSIGVKCSKEIPGDRMPITYALDELSDILDWFLS